MSILTTVLPVFLVIGLGRWLAALGFIEARVNAALAKLVFYVAAPVLLLRSVARTPLSEALELRTFAPIFAATFLVGLVVYLGAARVAPARRGVLAQGAQRSNMVFVGLPVIAYALGEEVLGPAAVLVAVVVVLYNFLAVLVLTLPHRNGAPWTLVAWARTAHQVARNPLILGSAAGMLLSALGCELPLCLDRSLELVGRIAMPLALISVGAGLDVRGLRAELLPAAGIAAIKLVLYPALVYGGLRWMGIEGTALVWPVLLMGSPTAVVSCIMAREMKGDEHLAAAIVLATTLGSFLTLSGWIALLG